MYEIISGGFKVKTMVIDIQRSKERGSADHGWLHTRYSFSFSDYYNPQRIGFGALRVLNEDWIEPGKGFGKHPHDNMEIVTIILQGSLEHKDSMGNTGFIKTGEVQRMSAGIGVFHSEVNPSKTEKVHLLQIWIESKERDIQPSYEQKSFGGSKLRNQLVELVSGIEEKQDKKESNKYKALYIHQNALFLYGLLDTGKVINHTLSSAENGVYLFLIKGKVKVAEHTLKQGDALGISEVKNISIEAIENTEILIIEIPMK